MWGVDFSFPPSPRAVQRQGLLLSTLSALKCLTAPINVARVSLFRYLAARRTGTNFMISAQTTEHAMPQLTLTIGGPFREPISGKEFFAPLFSQLSLEPTINPELLKGTVRKIDEFAIGVHSNQLTTLSAFAHLEMAVLDGRRTSQTVDTLANQLDKYVRDYFQRSIKAARLRCYITSDVRLIPERWHRSISRGQGEVPTRGTESFSTGTLFGNSVNNAVFIKRRKENQPPFRGPGKPHAVLHCQSVPKKAPKGVLGGNSNAYRHRVLPTLATLGIRVPI